MPRRPSPTALLLSALMLFAAALSAQAQTATPPANGNGAGQAQQAPSAPANGNGGNGAAPVQDDAARARQAEIAAMISERANRELGVDVNDTLSRWKRDLDRIEQGLADGKATYPQLNTFREQLERLREDATGFVAKLAPWLEAVNVQAEKLGAPPAQGDTPEPEEAARTRAEISGLVSTYNSAKSVAEQTALRANQLISRIQDIRRARFTSRLFERASGILSLDAIAKFPDNFGAMLTRAGGIVGDWWRGLGMQGGRDAQTEALQLLALAVALWAGLFFLMQRGVARLRARSDAEEPPFWKRAGSAAGVIALRALPITLPTLFLYHSLRASELIADRIDWLFYSGARSIIIVAVVNALIKTVLSPHRPEWRLVPASDAAAYRVRWLVVALAAVFALQLVLTTLSRLASAPLSLTVTQSFLASLIVSGLIIAILRTRLNGAVVEGAPELRWLRSLYWPVLLLAAAILVTALSGYVALSLFIATQVIVTGTILAVVYLMMIWVDALGQSMGDDEAETGRWLQSTFGFDAKRRSQLALPVTLSLKFLVLLCSVPLIMLQWGFNWQDVMDWLRQLLFGFQIGNTQISVAAILAAVIVFMLGYIGAKLFQGWLDKQVLKPAGLSGSIRDSIRTTVGYLGVVVAALVAFSYAGLDLSNLAIVAGAFSVGIGFGLQSIVNNFVSGLILLAERPIKVGDWVVVGGEEGLVRKISVRSTEIETFDRANVLVPNSYFITESVKNWTLHNNMGRIAIPVGVDYDSDPRMVKELLLDVARNHVNVMSNPEPFVVFQDFGNDALQFVLYAYLYDLTKGLGTRTDLRISIIEEFRKAGVGIPYRQTDVTLKDMDWLKAAVSQYVAALPSGAAAKNGPGSADEDTPDARPAPVTRQQ